MYTHVYDCYFGTGNIGQKTSKLINYDEFLNTIISVFELDESTKTEIIRKFGISIITLIKLNFFMINFKLNLFYSFSMKPAEPGYFSRCIETYGVM